MLKVTQVNAETRPDLFLVPVDKEPDEIIIDEYGSQYLKEGKTVYAKIKYEKVADDEIVLRKRCDGGFQDLHIYKDRLELVFVDDTDGKETKMAESRISLEYVDWADSKWKEKKFDKEPLLEMIEYGVARVYYEDDQASLEVIIDWNTGKQTYRLRMDGHRVRCLNVMIIEDDQKVKYHHDDYKDKDKVEEGKEGKVKTVRYAKDGIANFLEVDPYLELAATSSTITVTCPDDTITFTVSTAAATLMDVTPVRVWVKEDGINWFIYHDRMFREGSGSTTGMSGNNYSQQTIETDWSWYPLNSTVNSNASSITTGYQDKTIGAPTTGTDADDLYIAKGSDGWAGDGALHLDPDSSGTVEFDWDATRYAPKVVLHEAEMYTGDNDNPTGHLLEWFEFDDDAANSTITAKVGNNATYRNVSDGSTRNTSTDSVTGIRGKSLDTKALGYVDLDMTNYPNSFFQKGTIIITLSPQWTYTTAAKIPWSLYVSADDHIRMRWAGATYPYFSPWLEYNNTNYFVETDTYDNNDILQKPHVLITSWDASRNFLFLGIDGRVADVRHDVTATPSSSDPSLFLIGCQYNRVSAPDMVLHELKTYDDAIVPYGTPFIDHGNDYTDPHYTVKSYIRGDETNGTSLKIGSGTISVTNCTPSSNGILVTDTGDIASIATSGNMNMSKGQISFWFKSDTTSPNSLAKLLISSTNDNYFQVSRNSTDLNFYLNNTNVVSSGIADIWDQQWHFVVLRWDAASNWRFLSVDGIVGIDTTGTSFTAPSFTTLYIGNRSDGIRECDGTIKDLCITDDPFTPLGWSVGVEPRLLPVLNQ